ncbi:MAG: flagellar basal-body MS-ring/collar protein FliF, partial [Syntrophales bacterium]|nr:flagellar basal-body MS-ring/collar protein FliF [Syntrophales bacterium]
MNPNMQKYIQGFLNLPPARKMTVVGVLILTAVCLGAMVYFSNQVDYGILFSNLNSEDAGAITAKLKEKKIPFQLSTDGRAISIPVDKVSELRLEMAASGLPHGGGIGFEIFDNKTLGATEFEQQISYRRALQGELSRTINGLDEIQSSRVHIALPKDSIFVDQQRKATASVTVKLKSGRSLKPQQVDGIVHLVASSIEGLSPADVMVVDSKGNVLSKMPTDPRMPGLSGTQAEYQRNLERDMAGRIQTMLENVVGKGKAAVQVNADLDFRVTEKTEEVYDAENPVIRSTQKESDKSTSKAGDPKAASGTEKEKSEETTNYEINRTVSKTIMPVGDVKKLSIAVLVDGTYVKDAKGVETYQERPKKEIEMLEEIVRKSSGFNPQRGDQVVVTSMAFQKSDASEMASAPWTDKIAPFMPIVKYLLVAAAALMAFMLIIRPLLKNISSAAGSVDGIPGGIVNV